MTKVRTTMQPDKEIEVGPQEFVDLQRQGLLLNAKKAQVDTTGTNVVAVSSKES